jgi:tetratricopeptide (TPR) repeat protein
MKSNQRLRWLILLCFSLTIFLRAQFVKVVAPNERQMRDRLSQAQRLEREGQMESAAEIYKFLCDAQPDNYAVYRSYVSLLFRQKDLSELERVIVRFTQRNPKNEEAAVDLGRLYYARGDSALAFDEWQQAITRFGHALNFYRALFNGMISLGINDQAEALIGQARAHYAQPDLMALELANFQSMRGKYLASAREYLLYAHQNPRHFEMITTQILRFPTDSLLFCGLDSLLVAAAGQPSAQTGLNRLRAELLFKYERFEAAFDEIIRVENMTGNRGDQALNFLKNLVQIRRYKMAQQLYSRLLAIKELQAVAPQALLGLAEAFEKEVLEESEAEPLHYFYPGNQFFNTDFIQHVSENGADLQRAFAIYDSLITDQPQSVYSAQALFRLADLRYRVVRDFDGALNLYQKAWRLTREPAQKLACQKRIGEVQLARGDLRAAVSHFRKEAERSEGGEAEKELRFQLARAYFLAQEFDSLAGVLSDLMPLLGPQHPLFNDAIAFDGFFRLNYSEADAAGKQAFGEFARAESFFHQNKLSETESVCHLILKNFPDVTVASAARFRLIQINLQFGRRPEAETLAEVLFDTENEYADQAAFLLADVAYRRDGDRLTAGRYYEIILEKFPNSLLSDTARKRLRELQKSLNPLKES